MLIELGDVSLEDAHYLTYGTLLEGRDCIRKGMLFELEIVSSGTLVMAREVMSEREW